MSDYINQFIKVSKEPSLYIQSGYTEGGVVPPSHPNCRSTFTWDTINHLRGEWQDDFHQQTLEFTRATQASDTLASKLVALITVFDSGIEEVFDKVLELGMNGHNIDNILEMLDTRR